MDVQRKVNGGIQMAQAIRELEIRGDRVMLTNGKALVASKSEPGVWYAVEDGACTCRGFSYRAQCRHILAGAEALQAEPEPKRVTVPTGRAALRLLTLDD